MCVRSASTDLCGGCRATGIPTATGGLPGRPATFFLKLTIGFRPCAGKAPVSARAKAAHGVPSATVNSRAGECPAARPLLRGLLAFGYPKRVSAASPVTPTVTIPVIRTPAGLAPRWNPAPLRM